MVSGKKIFLLIALSVALVAAIGGAAVFVLLRSGITGPIDNKFGDQHLKTTVALVELHKTRFGHYPRQLSELRFAGEWDAIALNSTRYCTNADQTAYYVEVHRGWAGKPTLTLPDGFWSGTGYDPALGPCMKARNGDS